MEKVEPFERYPEEYEDWFEGKWGETWKLETNWHILIEVYNRYMARPYRLQAEKLPLPCYEPGRRPQENIYKTDR